MADVQKFINTLIEENGDDIRKLRQKLASLHIDLNWRDFSDLYILNVSNKSDLSNPLVRKCNGVVFDQNTHKIVCYSFPVFMNQEDYPGTLPGANPGIVTPVAAGAGNPIKVESMYDGTLMKIFYHPSSGKWETATTKCFDAARSHWTSKKSFHQLLMETLGAEFNFASLDKKKCYIGLLIHPENKLVSDYSREQIFVHTGTCNLETLEFEDNYTKLPGDNIILPEKKEFANVEELTNFLKKEELKQPIRPGFICLLNGERYKFMSPHYTMCKELRGNIQNMKYRLLEMQSTPDELQKFIKLFPEFNELNEEVKDDIAQLGEDVYRNYANYYFKHQKDKKYPDDIFDAIKAVNTKYREDLEKVGGDRSRIKTDASTIAQFLVTKYPFDRLCALLGYKENTNRKEKVKAKTFPRNEAPNIRSNPSDRQMFSRNQNNNTISRNPKGRGGNQATRDSRQVPGAGPRNTPTGTRDLPTWSTKFNSTPSKQIDGPNFRPGPQMSGGPERAGLANRVGTTSRNDPHARFPTPPSGSKVGSSTPVTNNKPGPARVPSRSKVVTKAVPAGPSAKADQNRKK